MDIHFILDAIFAVIRKLFLRNKVVYIVGNHNKRHFSTMFVLVSAVEL